MTAWEDTHSSFHSFINNRLLNSPLIFTLKYARWQWVRRCLKLKTKKHFLEILFFIIIILFFLFFMQGTQPKMSVSYSIHALYSIAPTYFVLLVGTKIFFSKYFWLMLANDAFIKLIWFVKKETVTFSHSFEYGDSLFHCIIKKVNWNQITKRTVRW